MKNLRSAEYRHTLGGKLLVAAAAVGIVAWAPASVGANIGDEIANVFSNGEFDVNLRYRYEFVDQDNNGKRDANASTLRTRLVFKTAKWYDFDITVNMDDLRPIIADNFNDTRNGKSQYQTVADPKGTDLNIAALTYSGLKNTTFVLGRQRIIRNNARFIGNVGWRQNEQTYDALSANYKDDMFSASYVFVDGVNRIFGPESRPAGAPAGQAKDFNSNSHLVDAAYTLNNWLSVAAYAYLLDLDAQSAPTAASNRTFGVRFTGKPKINDDMSVSYLAEYATQEDYKDNPISYDADYIRAEAGFNWKQYSIKAGYELLESDQSATTAGMIGFTPKAFQTPLATLHAHNGWVDKFLSTPGGGLEDVYIAASAKVGGVAMTLVYHDYSADTGGVDFGQEIDFVAKYAFNKHYSVLGKVGLYDADNGVGNPNTGSLGQDTTKAWVMLTAAF